MKLLINSIALLVLIAGAFAVGYNLPHEPERVTTAIYVPYPEVESKEVERVITEYKTREKIVRVPIHNEPGLYEFKNKGELADYIRWYRNEKMVQHGVDQCEDYAYDFMGQAIADGYLVSTEIIEKPSKIWHIANTVPIGNDVYLVNISSGSIKLYALKD